MRDYAYTLDSRSSKDIFIVMDWIGICIEQVSNF